MEEDKKIVRYLNFSKKYIGMIVATIYAKIITTIAATIVTAICATISKLIKEDE